MTESAWDRQRTALRREITIAARDLFTTRGFAETTIDDIAAAVGISRRSFFRYFGTKEDVLLGDLIARGEAIARALRVRPADEDPWDALHAAMRDSLAETMSDQSSDLAIGRLMTENSSLRAKAIEKHQRWSELLTPLVARHVKTHPPEYVAAAIVATALACLDVASAAWVQSDGRASLEQLYFDAIEAIRG